ncbi:MAG: hypothetical protein MZV49_14545 [Rhodopseudomonas palustris]|nr:hypothetical protein [Rhodopseudomonas palustris]
MIKPSHYDDDGYVIQWARSFDPVQLRSPTLYGLVARLRRAPGSGRRRGDPTSPPGRRNQHPHQDRARSSAQIAGGQFRPGLPGGRTDPISSRAPSISRAPARGGRPGVHRRLPRERLPGDAARRFQRRCSEAMDLGITLYAGEAEGRLRCTCCRRRRAAASSKPLYNYHE